MKKVFILLVIALSFVESANAQKLFSKEWREWSAGKDSASIAKKEEAKKADDVMYFKNTKSQVVVNSNIEYAGILLEKSAKFQYGAIGCATASAGLLIGYGCKSDKFEMGDGNKAKLTKDSKILIASGGALALIAIILEINAIEYKNKAGKCLRMQSTENGAGIAYVF